MILIITNTSDITSDLIVNRLNSIRVPYYRLNTDELLKKGLSFEFENNEYILIDKSKEIVINLTDINSIYYRRPTVPSFQDLDLTTNEKTYLSNEFLYLLEGIYKILKDKYWISPVIAIREAENKMYQLILAKRIGFNIPESLITSIKEKAEEFLKSHDYQCIIKPIKSGLVSESETTDYIFTSSFDKEKSDLSRVEAFPIFLQKLVKKQADVRVTVVGSKIFATKITSDIQDNIDWRRLKPENQYYSEIILPPNIEEQCLELTNLLGLQFGAIDFVIDENGKLWFLEINPNGQWGWIEKRLGLDISGAITDLLQNASN